jgi:cytochrome c6
MKTMLTIALLGVAVQAGAQAVDGKTLYTKNCAACHQAGGAGIPGAFPALKGSAFVQGAPDAVIATVLKGRAGMPTFASAFDDGQMALVLSYVRQSWGNKGAAISAADVQAVRAQSGAGAVVKQETPLNLH